MTYKLCFHTNDEGEAKRMLEYLKLDITRENINTLMRLKNGECLFSDLYGRVSRLQFDAIFDDIIKFFSTTPEPEADAPPEAEQTENVDTDFGVMSEPEPEKADILAIHKNVAADLGDISSPEPEPEEIAQEPQEADVLEIHKTATADATDTTDLLAALEVVRKRYKSA